jgi:indole-3-glycerol phosphate synthase
MTEYLSAILSRKRRENERRRRHLASRPEKTRVADARRGARAIEALSRAPGRPPSVMAEVKFRSPSAGQLRPSAPGEGLRVAQSYEDGGASVVSVLADGPGFGGSPLLVRQVARGIGLPVLYKGFVLDPVQVDLAFDVGASLVLLLVRALQDRELETLIARTRALGMEPVVEAANADEVDRAVAVGAKVIGVNARDLTTFEVDKHAASACIERIPEDCIAVFMSGVRTAEDFRDVAQTRADAVLIGEELMRAEDPGARLAELLSSV